MTKVTIAPITSTIKGLSGEVMVGPHNGLDHDGAVSLDNVLTVSVGALGRTLGHLTSEQELQLARRPFRSEAVSPQLCQLPRREDRLGRPRVGDGHRASIWRSVGSDSRNSFSCANGSG